MSELRTAIVQVAIDLTVTDGWSAITMERVAQVAGVSRQTVYNEIGGKTHLAQAMIDQELQQFLIIVQRAFTGEADPQRALQLAGSQVLAFGQHHPLLGVIVGGGAGDLLPLLTIDAASIHTSACDVLMMHLDGSRETVALVDVIVRLVLSYLTRPATSLARAQEHLAHAIAALSADQSDFAHVGVAPGNRSR